MTIDTIGPENSPAHATTLGSDFEDTNEAASDRRWRSLSDIDRHNERDSTNAKTSNESTSDEHADLSMSRCHEGATSKEDQRGVHDRLFATNLFSQWECKESTEEASCLKRGDDVALEGVSSSRGYVDKVEISPEGVEGKCATNDGRIIAHYTL